MARVPRRRRVAAALALVVAATCAASSSGHPLDRFHELVDDPATTVVRGPGSVAKQAEASSGSGAADAVAAAVDSWHADTRATPLADVAPAREASHGREEDGGNADDAIEAIVSSKALGEPKPCAPCDGCSVDWAAASASPFVKFVCIPGLPRHGTECEPGVPTRAETRLVTNTESLQRLSDFCGLESISTRSWVARVVGTAPAGLPLDPWSVHPDPVPVNQTGIFSSPARGIALSALCSRPEEGPSVLESVPSHQVAQAAVFDFLFCAGDRHTQNVYVADDASITLIDNDNLLGEQVYKPESSAPESRACAISSLFLPGTMESWRLRRSKYCGNRLGTLDYR